MWLPEALDWTRLASGGVALMDNRGQRQRTRCPECQGSIELVRPSEYGYGSWSLDEPAPTVDYRISYATCDGEGHSVKVFWKKSYFTGYG